MTNKIDKKFDLLTSVKMTDVEREAFRLSQANRSLKHYMIIAVIVSLAVGFATGVAATFTGVSTAKSITTVEVKVDQPDTKSLEK